VAGPPGTRNVSRHLAKIVLGESKERFLFRLAHVEAGWEESNCWGHSATKNAWASKNSACHLSRSLVGTGNDRTSYV